MAIHLIPAYGRQYTSKWACLDDWLNGKDFKIHNGPYCSIRDLDAMVDEFETIMIHWCWPEGVEWIEINQK